MKNLIIYFSYSGNTQKLVKDVNSQFNFDVARLERSTPYPTDYNTCAYGEAKEEYLEQIHPPIIELNQDFSQYDRILLFFPIWWYTFPMTVATLIKKLKDYKGEIILFENSYTHDPQYAKNSLDNFKKINNKLNVRQGLFNKSVNEHIAFIKNLDN